MNLYKDSTKINQFLQEHLKIRDSKILPWLLFTPRPLHSAAKAVRTCKFSQEGIQSFAKGELSMDWMPLLFAAQPIFGWGVNSNLPCLPQNLEELAATEGAFRRKRGIRSVQDLLKMLFLYTVPDLSFRIPAAACAPGIASISKTAWRKRFSGAVPFLRAVPDRMLSGLLTAVNTPEGIKNVYLVDASIIRQQGKEQKQQRIRLCYNPGRNRMEQVKVTDNHTAESLTRFNMGKGDLILADAGYGTAGNYIHARECGADVITRITPESFRFYDEDGQNQPLIKLLRKAAEKNQYMADRSGFCRYRNKTGFLRVIAWKLPEEETEKSGKRKRRKASKNQSRITDDTLFHAGYIVLITSPEAGYGAEKILRLYKSRRQVELLFKRFKQSFGITTAKAGSGEYSRALILLQLIIWVIAERQSFCWEMYLKEKEKRTETVYTIYESCKTAFIHIKTILCLPWGLFTDLTDKKYRWFLSKPKWQRINQNEEFHTTILPGLPA